MKDSHLNVTNLSSFIELYDLGSIESSELIF